MTCLCGRRQAKNTEVNRLSSFSSLHKGHTMQNGEIALYMGCLVDTSDGVQLSNGAELVPKEAWSGACHSRLEKQALEGSN